MGSKEEEYKGYNDRPTKRSDGSVYYEVGSAMRISENEYDVIEWSNYKRKWIVSHFGETEDGPYCKSRYVISFKNSEEASLYHMREVSMAYFGRVIENLETLLRMPPSELEKMAGILKQDKK